MKKAKILLTLSLLALGSLAGCKNNDTPAENQDQNNQNTDKEDEQGQNPGGNGGENPGGNEDDKPGEDPENPGDDDVPPPVIIKKDFASALAKDYSNMTVFYEDSASGEYGYEYYAEDLVLVYDGLFAETYGNNEKKSPYTFYSNEVNGDYYTYWRAVSGYNHDGWIANGLYNADLAIFHAYFYLPEVLNRIEAEDVEYYAETGQYFVKDDKIDSVFDGFEAFWWFHNYVEAIAFNVNEAGYISTITAVDSMSRDDSPYFKITLSNFGTTAIPDYVGFDTPDTPNENNIYTYEEMTGKPADDRIFPTSVAFEIQGEHKSSETYDLILDIDESVDVLCQYLPDTVNRTSFEWVSSNENVAAFDFKQNYQTGHKFITGIADGDCEIYVISHDERNNTTVESPHIKVHVNKAPEIVNEDAIYNFAYQSMEAFTVTDEGGNEVYGGEKVNAQNLVGNALPYEITTFRGQLLDGKNTEALGEFNKVIALSPCSSDHMNDGFYNEISFDFDDQQVSKFSTYYSLHNSNQAQFISSLAEAKLMTSNDGVTWNEIDIKDELVSTLSASNGNYTLNKKILTREFTPASKVKLFLKGNSVGKNLQFVFGGTSFEANDECQAHVASETVPVESVTISSDINYIVAHKQYQFNVEVLPANATNKNVRWYSSDPSIVKVDTATGVIEGLKEGNANVYAMSVDGNVKSNEIDVHVSLPSVPNAFRGSFTAEGIVNYKFVNINITIEEHKAVVSYSLNEEETSLELFYMGEDSHVHCFEANDGTIFEIRDANPGFEGKLYKGNSYIFGALNAEDTITKVEKATSVTILDDSLKQISSLNFIEGQSCYVTPIAYVGTTKREDIRVLGSSSNENVIKVDGWKLTAVGAGDCVVTFASIDGGASATINVHVDAKILITTLEITNAPASNTIKIGDSHQLVASYLPQNANLKNLIWSTSNQDIVTVTNGKISGVASGKATITVTDSYSHLSASIEITVSEEQSSCIFGEWVGTYDLSDSLDSSFSAKLNQNNTIEIFYEGELIKTFKMSGKLNSSYYSFVDADPASTDETVYMVSVESAGVTFGADGYIEWLFDYDHFVEFFWIR